MTAEEEMALRELAANPHYISKVSEVLGPLSLWSKDGLEREIRKAVEAEREACAKFVEEGYVRQFERPWREDLAAAIRTRGQA